MDLEMYGKMKMPQSLKLAPPSSEVVSHHLEGILSSQDFHATPQQSAFLKYVVDQTLAGNADRIKGYTVATEVFGRRQDFNQSIDPIVSIQAAGLRRALKSYYRKAGRRDALQIEIPKGSYIPSFIVRRPEPKTDAKIDVPKSESRVQSFWPAVRVQSLKNISGDPVLDFWGVGLASEIALELNHYPDIVVIFSDADNPKPIADPRNIQFAVEGNVISDGACIKITVRLIDALTGRQIWCDSNHVPIETAKHIEYQEDIARVIAVRIAGERGLISKAVASDLQRYAPKPGAVYAAVLNYYDYHWSYAPQALAQALTALEKATAIDPDCGQVWTMRARLFADMYALDLPGVDAPLDNAFRFARNGMRLLPDDPRAHLIMAYVYLLGNELEAGLAEAESALALGSRSFFMRDAIGYVMTLLGAWERGPALIEEVIPSNPFYGNFVHYARWVDALRNEDYGRARQETLMLNRPALFWDHLARAATFGLRGEIKNGRRSAAKLLRRKPDFPQRGRNLIRHFIKFDAIVSQVIEGLAAVGLTVR